MRRFHYIGLIGLAAAIFSACGNDIYERTIYEGSGLGYPEKTCDLEASAGALTVPVIANRPYTIRTDASWLQVPSEAPAGEEGFTFRYEANPSLPRKAKVIVAIEETAHYDTLTVRQRGQYPAELSAQSQVVQLGGSSSGSRSVALQTNIPVDEIALDHYAEGESDWISNLKLEGSALTFDYTANPAEQVRRGSISLRYEDAFGEVVSILFQLCQLSSSDSAGTPLSLADFCALASVSGVTLEEDLVIEGIVVSDKQNGNCGDNTQLSATSIDYDVCRQTIYFEALDGSCGVRMLTRTPDDNIFLQGDRVQFSLRGATLFKSDTGDSAVPVYYYVNDVRGNMAVSCEHLGREGIPVKEKYIGSLTDADIFTYVTFKECELPVRKGPLTPVSEEFTLAGGSDKVAKFGILLHDICGASMYLLTNTTCPYRRDGHCLPYGSGPMSGVVVHELYSRFSWQDNDSADQDSWGNIGRYQLRHTCPEDFGMAQTMAEASFSAILCEWRYILDKNLERYYATDGDKTAYFDYSFIYPDTYTDGRAGKLPINKMKDYAYLGPVGASATGNVNGLGVILEDGSDWMSPSWDGYNSEFAADVNAKGTGTVTSDAGSAWSTNLTARNGAPMYTTLVFSTAGISSSKMSLQLSSMNYFYSSTQKIGGIAYYLEGPRYWWVEYSLDGKAWEPVAKYSLPELCQVSPMTQLWQTAGYKPVNVPLPADRLLGRDKVWIRIIPDAAMQSGTPNAYLDPAIIYPNSGSFPTAWNYIGIRYNTREAPATDFGGDGGIDPMNPVDYNW